MKKALSIIAVLALVSVLCVALVACVPSDPDKAVEKLEKAGYEAEKLEGAAAQLAAVNDDVEYVVIALKGLDDGVMVLYFEDADDAKECYEELKADYEKADEEAQEKTKIGKSGKVVYTGSKDAVKALG